MFQAAVQIFQQTIDSGLLVHEILHAVIAAPLGLLLWRKTKNKKILLIYFLVTYFLDLDHLFDYWRYDGFNFNLNTFLNVNYFRENGQAIVAFHGWEYIGLFGYLVYKKGWKNLYAAIFLGMTSHLILDVINVESVAFYSVIYRILTGFALPN